MIDLCFAWDALSAPQTGRYVLERQLGLGGMGDVYQARDAGSGRKIALKIARRDFDTAEERRRARLRLLREGWILSRIRHPNVVELLDVSASQRHAMLAIELVDGCNLSAWTNSGPTWNQVLSVYLDAGRGLAAVHDVCVVHRDFKPSNVLLGDDGRVRVADFGLALPEGIGESIDGFVVGTPRYMAPEHRNGAPASKLADQYSFCLSLGESLLKAHDANPSTERPPSRIWDILEIGMRKDPSRRFGSMRGLLECLQVMAPPALPRQ